MEKKHSGLGIASFIISIICGLAIFSLIVLAGVMDATTPGGIDENSAEAIILGLFLIAFLILDFIGIGLGIGGLCQKNRNKIFAVLGVIFTALTILLTLAIMIVGTVS